MLRVRIGSGNDHGASGVHGGDSAHMAASVRVVPAAAAAHAAIFPYCEVLLASVDLHRALHAGAFHPGASEWCHK